MRVLAAGLHPRVRSGASGSHYTSTGALPLIPGIDGVGGGPAAASSCPSCCSIDPGQHGRADVAVDRRRSVVLPADVDVGQARGGDEPRGCPRGLPCDDASSFSPGQSVLVLGASGQRGPDGGSDRPALWRRPHRRPRAATPPAWPAPGTRRRRDGLAGRRLRRASIERSDKPRPMSTSSIDYTWGASAQPGHAGRPHPPHGQVQAAHMAADRRCCGPDDRRSSHPGYGRPNGDPRQRPGLRTDAGVRR